MMFTADTAVRYHPQGVLFTLANSRPHVTARMLVGLALWRQEPMSDYLANLHSNDIFITSKFIVSKKQTLKDIFPRVSKFSKA